MGLCTACSPCSLSQLSITAFESKKINQKKQVIFAISLIVLLLKALNNVALLFFDKTTFFIQPLLYVFMNTAHHHTRTKIAISQLLWPIKKHQRNTNQPYILNIVIQYIAHPCALPLIGMTSTYYCPMSAFIGLGLGLLIPVCIIWIFARTPKQYPTITRFTKHTVSIILFIGLCQTTHITFIVLSIIFLGYLNRKSLPYFTQSTTTKRQH
ncbi:MAG: hypothetical protein ACON5A_02850 [Candidatus Comchoanobacterales bacterium]